MKLRSEIFLCFIGEEQFAESKWGPKQKQHKHNQHVDYSTKFWKPTPEIGKHRRTCVQWDWDVEEKTRKYPIAGINLKKKITSLRLMSKRMINLNSVKNVVGVPDIKNFNW